MSKQATSPFLTQAKARRILQRHGIPSPSKTTMERFFYTVRLDYLVRYCKVRNFDEEMRTYKEALNPPKDRKVLTNAEARARLEGRGILHDVPLKHFFKPEGNGWIELDDSSFRMLRAANPQVCQEGSGGRPTT